MFVLFAPCIFIRPLLRSLHYNYWVYNWSQTGNFVLDVKVNANFTIILIWFGYVGLVYLQKKHSQKATAKKTGISTNEAESAHWQCA